jgi:hypothetical protein
MALSCGHVVEKAEGSVECTMSGCDHVIKKNEVYLRIIVNMGQGRTKYVRICATCLLTQARELFTVDPDLKERLVERLI